MAILRVKDENGNIIEIPAIKGEKGDKGDPGDAANINIQLNGTSIVQDGVANIPKMSNQNFGVAKTWDAYGITIEPNSGYLQMIKADTYNIDIRNANYRAIVPTNLDYAVKAALTDGKGPEYTPEEQLAARERLGVVDTNEIYIGADEMPEGCVLRINPEGEATPIVSDIQINDTSIVADSVANIPLGAPNVYGVVKLGDNWYSGLEIDKYGQLKLRSLSTDHINNRSSYTSGVLHGANYDYAVKQALCDGKGEAWTLEEQKMAQKRIGSEQWRLIANAEITEAVRAISFDKDIDGNPFNLRKVRIYLKTIRSEDSTTDGSGRLFINDMPATTTQIIAAGWNIKEQVYYTNIFFELTSDGKPMGFRTTSSTSLGQHPALNTTCVNPLFEPQESVYKIKMDTDKQTALYGIGTTIEIWGVDV